MSVKLIYTCDRCGESWEQSTRRGYDERRLFTIELKVGEFRTNITPSWCRPCVDHFKLFQPVPDPNANTAPGVGADLRPASERLVDLIVEIAGSASLGDIQ